MDNLEINENNYKAYTELWLNREDSFKLGKIMLLTIGEMVICSIPSFLHKNSFVIAISACLSVAVPTITAIICIHSEEKKVDKKLKEKYPYIDTKISQDKLYECLKKARIIVEDEQFIDISVKRYEDILKYHKIQDQLLEEKKRDYYRLDYDNTVSKEELEKVKIKVKTLVRNGKK